MPPHGPLRAATCTACRPTDARTMTGFFRVRCRLTMPLNLGVSQPAIPSGQSDAEGLAQRFCCSLLAVVHENLDRGSTCCVIHMLLQCDAGLLGGGLLVLLLLKGVTAVGVPLASRSCVDASAYGIGVATGRIG